MWKKKQPYFKHQNVMKIDKPDLTNLQWQGLKGFKD